MKKGSMEERLSRLALQRAIGNDDDELESQPISYYDDGDFDDDDDLIGLYD